MDMTEAQVDALVRDLYVWAIGAKDMNWIDECFDEDGMIADLDSVLTRYGMKVALVPKGFDMVARPSKISDTRGDAMEPRLQTLALALAVFASVNYTASFCRGFGTPNDKDAFVDDLNKTLERFDIVLARIHPAAGESEKVEKSP
jgi:hypothetical protein